DLPFRLRERLEVGQGEKPEGGVGHAGGGEDEDRDSEVEPVEPGRDAGEEQDGGEEDRREHVGVGVVGRLIAFLEAPVAEALEGGWPGRCAGTAGRSTWRPGSRSTRCLASPAKAARPRPARRTAPCRSCRGPNERVPRAHGCGRARTPAAENKPWRGRVWWLQ